MANFLDNAWEQYRRGWQQQYGQAQPTTQYAEPIDYTVGSPNVTMAAEPEANRQYYQPVSFLPIPAAPIGGTPYVGAPLGAQQYDQYGQPITDPSELSPTDTSALAASGQGRAKLANYSGPVMPKTDSGQDGQGGQGQGQGSGSGEVGFINAVRSLFGGSGGGAVGGSEQTGNLLQGYMNYTGDAGTAGGAAGGGGGFGGGAGASIAGAVSGALSSFAKTAAKDLGPVSIDPSKWAGPVPSGAVFVPPSLARNTGGNWNYTG
jgi:hypothetical protein